MYRNSIIALVMLILILERGAFTSPMNISACFTKGSGHRLSSWCPSELTLCANASFAYIMSVITSSIPSIQCNEPCTAPSTGSSENFSLEVLGSTCNGQRNCSLANITIPSDNQAGEVTLTFLCNNTASTSTLNPTASPPTPSIPDSNTKASTKGTLSSMDLDVSSYGQASKNTLNTTVSPPPSSISGLNTTTSPEGMSSGTDPDVSSPEQVTDNRYTAAIVVSVVVPITTVVVVVSILMYRRGHCKLLVGICTKRFEKHSADRADAYALSSTANANPTYNFSNDVHLNGCDVDYTEIDKIIKEPDVEYNHLNLIKKEAVHEPTYNHIGHLNSSSGNTEQTYDHVGNETLQKTDLFTLQQDTHMYSHIGALAKPASEQMVEDSYAHINGVMKDPSTFDETNQYDVASFHLNVGPAGDFGNQDMK